MKKLEDIICYNLSVKLSDLTWNIVSAWNNFAKNTMGSQLVRAVDSVAANIAEGFGRYHKKDKIKFYYNARGSLFESQFFIKRALERKTITQEQFETLISVMRLLPTEINYRYFKGYALEVISSDLAWLLPSFLRHQNSHFGFCF